MDQWLDEGKWQQLAVDLKEDLEELVSTFCEDVPLSLQEMEAALCSGDYETIARLAHSLKSSSGIFGAYPMVKQCKLVELAAGDQDNQLQAKIDDLSQVFQAVQAALYAHLGR